ncbi:MAG: hypothetical protein KME60_07925 [Cyanomargarita calcarea GSE-NOS-MK-12-04C]|jgi:hypothetical protein|uniref:Uncharacterized protein n=1 Tax=Cyanomargarita calcarea GSE-NOS-MK-12-04C TaxID=2839659 RepID=A0A951UU27_9CYAN|nr:hypothetical protein [Cyanomargarita calcarea GSE-NOS-MK-12-04C]
MSVLKTQKAQSSRIQGIFRYLLQIKGQRQRRDLLENILSPDKLVEHIPDNKEKPKDKKMSRPMFNDSLRESVKCGLLVKEDEEISINPSLPEDARNPLLGDKLLPDTLAHLFFASDNEDEEDFGRVCAWYLAQDIYDAPGNKDEVELQVNTQKVGDFLKMTSSPFFSQMDDWMRYIGFAWGHTLGGKSVIVPDPTAYIKRNFQRLFNGEEEITIQDFIHRLATQCPLFETGKFREEVEAQIGQRQTNYLSTTTAFALFRLQDEGDIKLERQSDTDLMILPKANNQVDNDGRISHVIWKGEKS